MGSGYWQASQASPGTVEQMFGTPQASVTFAVQQALSARGPMAEDELLDALIADGIDLGPEPEETLTEILDDDTELTMPLSDDRWAYVPALLEGRVFSHRLSAAEVEHDMMVIGPDLSPLSILTEIEPYQRLTDGSPMTEAFPYLDGEVLAGRGIPDAEVGGDSALLLEPGSFAALGVGVGDLVGLRVDPKGFELLAVESPSMCEVGARVAGLLEERADGPALLDLTVWMACADDDSLFREQAAPLGDLLSAAGLVVEGDHVALGGFDFGIWRVHNLIKTAALATTWTTTRRSPCWRRYGSASRPVN